jgi:N-acetylglucosamine kinase-like BadF-type ATPase
MSVVLGVDAGATKTHARLAEGSQTLGEVEGSGGNLTAVGEAVVQRVFKELLEDLGGPRVAAACVGAAGSDTPRLRTQLHRLLEPLLPGARLLVVHDAALVLPAAGKEHGIALIAGTGSVAWGRTRDGREARAGGWGHRLGDEGSGYWMVREAVRRILGAADAGRPGGGLAEAMLARAGALNASEFIRLFHDDPTPATWARHAPAVLAAAGAGDVEATAIVAEAAGYLIELAATVAERLGEEGPIVLAGGLLQQQNLLAGQVGQGITARLPGREVVILAEPPVAGAVRLAQRSLAG